MMYINPDIPPSYEVSLQAKLNDANQEIGALTERLSAAEQRGYERALDDAIEHFRGWDNWDEWAITEIEKVRAEYLKEGKNGKQN